MDLLNDAPLGLMPSIPTSVPRPVRSPRWSIASRYGISFGFLLF